MVEGHKEGPQDQASLVRRIRVAKSTEFHKSYCDIESCIRTYELALNLISPVGLREVN